MKVSVVYYGEGNGTPLQYSCLENPMEPGGLQSMGSQRVGQDRVTSLSLFTFMHWRRKWQPAPVLLPEESQGWGSLVGCHLWGCTWLKRLSSGVLAQASWRKHPVPLEKYKCKSDFQSKKSGKQPGVCLQKWKQDIHEIKIRENKWTRSVCVCLCVCVCVCVRERERERLLLFPFPQKRFHSKT